MLNYKKSALEMVILRTFKPRAFSISDFYEWYKDQQLILNPKFQRRAVWTPQSKSNLINTIVLGLPLPIFFIRVQVNPETKKSVREVVDGQQRFRAIFDFIDNGFPIKKSQNDRYGGKYFSELPEELRADFLSYEIAVNVLVDIDDKDVLDIFARLNSYGVRLNNQELLNAKYFGVYKQFVYGLGYDYSAFWETNRIFSPANMLRMKEAEFVSELLAAILGGIQETKAAEKYYKIYDDEFANKEEITVRFHNVMDMIGNIFSGDLSLSKFSLSPLFYSLFVVLYHMNYGIPDFPFDRVEINPKKYSQVRSALDEIEELFIAEGLTAMQQDFITACKKSTTHKINKKKRCDYLAQTILRYIE